MNLLKYLIVAVCVVSLLMTAVPASAAPSWWPLVPCGLNAEPEGRVGYTEPCNRCDLFKLLKNLIDFTLFALMPILATLFFVIAGFHIVLAGGNMSSFARGKQIFWDTVKAVAVLSISWLLVNTLIRSLARDQNAASSWWKFECRVTVRTPTRPTPFPAPGSSGSPTSDLCNNTTELAKKYNTSAVIQNDPELEQLISCIQTSLPGMALGSQFTYDQSHSKCNFTRGNTVCDTKCSHTVNSCHYGGSSGSKGSLAVDFGNEAIGDEIVDTALNKCGAGFARCENENGQGVPCTSANHVHVSAKSCDGN